MAYWAADSIKALYVGSDKEAKGMVLITAVIMISIVHVSEVIIVHPRCHDIHCIVDTQQHTM